MIIIDVENLAIGVLYCLTSRAIPDLPGSTRANPSYEVWVDRLSAPPLRSQDVALFPMIVTWDVWEQVVVPVVNRIQLPTARGSRDFDTSVALLKAALTAQAKATGFLPPDPVEPTPDSPPSNGDPIIRSAPRGDPRYPVLDVLTIEYPDGNPRLVYPVVDGGPKGTGA